MFFRGARRIHSGLVLARGRAVGVLVAMLALLGLWAGALAGPALAGPALAAKANNCGSWHSRSAWDITAAGVSCHSVKSKFLPAFKHQGHVTGWKIKEHAVGGGNGYTVEKVVATKGSDKVTYHWKSTVCC